MSEITRNLIIGVVIAAIVGAALYAFNIYMRGSSTTATSTTTGGNGATVTGLEIGATGSSSVAIATLEPPSIERPITITASLSGEAQTILKANMETIIAQLRKEPKRVDLWLKLGVYRKIAGDYTGALEAWDYVAIAGPTSINYVAYGDEGDLYMNFIKDYPKAELNYKEAITINPHVIDYYRALYTMYRSFYKTNTSAAADIVAQGLKNNPDNPDLLQMQAALKK